VALKIILGVRMSLLDYNINLKNNACVEGESNRR